MLRAAMAAGTALGQRVRPIYDAGELVPDDLMIDLIRERLSEPDTRAGLHSRRLPADDAPGRRARRDAVRDRPAAVGRLRAAGSGRVAIERLHKRAVEEGRADDTADAIAKRIELYHQETEPLVSHYRLAGNLVGIHGDRTEKDVFAEIQEALDQARVVS